MKVALAAAGIMALMFGAMSVYGMVTRRDLTSWGSFFFMGLIGILLCSVINLFLHSNPLAWTISVIGAFTSWAAASARASA